MAERNNDGIHVDLLDIHVFVVDVNRQEGFVFGQMFSSTVLFASPS